MNPVDQIVQAGLAAAKAGRRDEARQLLLQAVQQNEQSEMAWFALSTLVDNADDEQICLENVLTLNPQNEVAQQKLARLRPGDVPAGANQITIHKESPPLSLAGAILYPERQTVSWQEPAPEPLAQTQLAYQAVSNYNDVWNQNVELCAYCAQELAEEERTCPKCKRHLIGHYFRYEKPEANLTILFVFTLGAGQLFFVDIMRGLMQKEEITVLAFSAIFAVLYVILAFGIYFRKFWAYLSTIILSLVVLALFGWGILGNFAYFPADVPLTEALRVSSEVTLTNGIRGLQVGAVFLAFIWAAFLTGPDFEQVEVRFTAKLRSQLNEAPAFYAVGQEYAQRGLWATTILHWQRAVALEPANSHYQKQLSQAYLRLGFYERGLDMLKSLHDRTSNPTLKAEISQLLAQAQQQANH